MVILKYRSLNVDNAFKMTADEIPRKPAKFVNYTVYNTNSI